MKNNAYNIYDIKEKTHIAKSNTDFISGFFGPEYVATKPVGNMKYMDWEKARKIVEENKQSTISAGLKEDWNYTSGIIFTDGVYCDAYVYAQSSWATPIIDVDGEEIDCWTEDETCQNLPEWWGKREGDLRVIE